VVVVVVAVAVDAQDLAAALAPVNNLSLVKKVVEVLDRKWLTCCMCLGRNWWKCCCMC